MEKELIETYKNERDTYKRLAELYINKYNEIEEREKEHQKLNGELREQLKKLEYQFDIQRELTFAYKQRRDINKFRIQAAISDLEETLEANKHFKIENKYGKNEWICFDVDHIEDLIKTLKGE